MTVCGPRLFLSSGGESQVETPRETRRSLNKLRSVFWMCVICTVFLAVSGSKLSEEAEFVEYLEDKRRLIKSAQSFVIKAHKRHPEWTREQIDVSLSEFIKKRSDAIFGGIDVRNDRQQYKESLSKRTIEGAQFDLPIPAETSASAPKLNFILGSTKIYKIDSFSKSLLIRYLVEKFDHRHLE